MKCLFFFLFFSGFTVFGQVSKSFSGFIRKKENAYFFYEVRHDSLLPPRYVVFTENDTIGLYETTTDRNQNGEREKYISAWGDKNDNTKINYNGFPYEKITIDGVGPYDMGDFIHEHYNQVRHAERDTIMEGYYMHQFEGRLFWPITNGRINQNTGWTNFEVINIDSINNAYYGKLRRGVYMKLMGTVKYGHDRYGHFGIAKFNFNVKQIIEIDTTKMLYVQLVNDLEIAPITHRADTIYAPKDFEFGRKYTYTGKSKKNTAKLVIEKMAPGKLKYIVEYYKDKKLVKTRSGNLELAALTYMWNLSYEYEEYIRKELNGYEPDVAIEMPIYDFEKKQADFYFTDRLFSKKDGVKIAMYLQKE